MRNLLMLLFLCQLANAVPVTFRVLGSSGVPAKGVLVIVQNLENHEAEVLRALSDEQGVAGRCEIRSGLYRMIATAPYGIWQTAIKEFIVRTVPLEMAIHVEPMPTHGYGDIVVIGTTWTELQFLQPDGQPLANANVFVRDRSATLYTERWYKTDARGHAKIEMISDPLVVVIPYRDAIMTTEVPEHDPPRVIRFSAD